MAPNFTGESVSDSPQWSDRLKNDIRWFMALTLALALMGCSGRDGNAGRTETGGHPGADGGPEPGSATTPSLEFEVAYPNGFSFLNGVRELSDGRILAADPLSQVVLRIDLEAGTADTLGSVGPGPKEYMEPDQVLPLTGDSTLLVDFGKTYLTVIDPDGDFVGGQSMMVPKETGFPGLLHPRFGDSGGRVYYQPSRSQEGGPPDSADVARFDLENQVGETAAVLWAPEVEQIRTPGHGFLPRLLEPRDDWAVGPDGRVAIIRAWDYSIEWYLPDGRVLKGPPNPLELFALDRETKEAYLPQMKAGGISTWIVAGRSGGEVRMGMSRGLSNEGPGVDDFEWAENLPPFRPDRTRISLAGEVWVERWLPPDSASRMDIFDEAGMLMGSIPLPPGRQLLGFGRGPTGSEVAYLAKTDEFDLMWLERYRVVRD